ncbi:MAG TPA: outer membrane beta-barrel protein [Polyangiaceae bacterium]
MSKRLLVPAASVLVALVPALAAAQQAPAAAGASCPPGSWFCAEPPQEQAAPAGQPVQTLKPLPGPAGTEPSTDADAPDADEATPPPPKKSPPPPPPMYRRPPPRIVYGPPHPYTSETPDAPPPYLYSRPQRTLVPPHEWGLNLHGEGAMIGGGSSGDAGLAGGGAGLRFKPVRSFGIEADFDVLGGDHDYQGNKRNETAFSINGLLFLNPRSRAQIYLLAGFGWSEAHVTCDSCSTPGDAHYDYFGGQIGAGLELRLTRVLALNADIRGFIRDRTDQLAQSQPEFQDPAGCATSGSSTGTCRSTNTSGGGLFTGGMTLYF